MNYDPMICEPMYNGSNTNNGDEFLSILSNLSKSGLESLLADQNAIKQMAMDSLDVIEHFVKTL